MIGPMKWVAASLLALLVASFSALALTVTACAAKSVPTKHLTYGGLEFKIPKVWSVYTAAQTEPCGVATPAVVIGNATASATCRTMPVPEVNTLVHLVPTSESQGTYASAAPQKPLSSPGETNRTRTFVHDGVHVLMTTTLISGKVAGSPTTVSPSDHIVWSVEAYFRSYPVAFIASSGGGKLGGSLSQAIAVVESVHPNSTRG
jgi:hypothetical protein